MGAKTPVPPTVFPARLLPPLLSLLHRPRAPQPPRGGLRLLGAGGHPGAPRQPRSPDTGTRRNVLRLPPPTVRAVGADPPPPHRALSVPSLLPPPGTGWGRREPPKIPPFPLGCAHRGPSAAEALGRRSPSPVTPGRKEGRSGAPGRDAGPGRRSVPGRGSPSPAGPNPLAPPRRSRAARPALPGRRRAGAAAEGDGGRRRRLRGGQGRRCLRPGALRAAAAGAGADRERGE